MFFFFFLAFNETQLSQFSKKRLEPKLILIMFNAILKKKTQLSNY